MNAILALDQGTTSSRAIVFDHEGSIRAVAQQEFRQIFPQAGWVEHDANEIWQTQLDTAREALKKASLTAADIAAIGITNQRETTVLWDRKTGEPIHNAIVWQDRRTSEFCDGLKAASRTMLYNLGGEWDDKLLSVLGVPRGVLPEVRSSSEVYAETETTLFGAPIKIAGIAGDQQAALFGQNCFERGLAKNTYGTGCFMLMNIGAEPQISRHKLLTTVAWRIGSQTDYALEGSVFIGGAAVQWLRDGLGIIKASVDVEKLAESVPESGGVYLVPAFAGLGAPHWDQYARGIIAGITRGTTAAHVARAALEGIAFQGGGATGVGIAVDAASRGYSVVLLEQHDFGKGTSSRSTKLVHGGVRYLQQGNISLEMEALKERGLLLRNAPHLVRDMQFIVPNYEWWETPFYGIGMKVYDLLAGKYGFGPSQILSRDEVLARIPTLAQDNLRGGVKYHDGQFDDARLLIDLASTAAEHGACLLNYTRVLSLLKDSDGFISGLTFRDEESEVSHTLAARCVINATGPFCDELRRADQPESKRMIAPSQSVHIVLSREFLRGETAIMVPHTRDGRVMFAIPWHGHAVVGTTDTAIPAATLEPSPRRQEIEFILETASDYLAKRPTLADVLSVFTGIRPLVKASNGSNTAALSRDHTIEISSSGLLTIAGGKWTTYRNMAEDAVDHAIVLGQLTERACITRNLRIRDPGPHEESAAWFARHEMARTVEDVLARRTRLLFFNARAAVAKAPQVARELAQELGRDEAWQHSQLTIFDQTANHFIPPSP